MIPSIAEILKDPKKAAERLNAAQLSELVEKLKNIRITGSPDASVPKNPAEFAEKISSSLRGNSRWLRAKHLDFLSTSLVDLEARRRRRLLISWPPRHGKSELTSYWFPFWFLARNPQSKVILCSYEAEFAAFWGGRVRDAVIEFGAEYGLELAGTSTARDNWRLTSGGSMMTAGAGGPITGKGADLLIIDDPIKNEEEAGSEVMREKLWSWWQTTAYTRVEPGGVVVVIATRWHMDDLIGRLERESDDGKGIKWDVIKIPALAEQDDPLGRAVGDPLWPERISLDELVEKKKGMSPYHWSALYQQRPTPEEGGAVKRQWWRYYEVPPADFDEIIQSWDLAYKDTETSDYCVGQVWGRRGAQFYLLHQVRERMNVVEVSQAARNMTLLFPKAKRKLVEDKANGPAMIASLQREIYGLIPVKPRGPKFARLQAVIPAIESGNVLLPGTRRADGSYVPQTRWVADFVEECAQFPNAANDDQVDAMTQALSHLMPHGWSFVEKDYKEAMHGQGMKTTDQLMASRLNKKIKERVQKMEKQVNRVGSIFSGSSARRW